MLKGFYVHEREELDDDPQPSFNDIAPLSPARKDDLGQTIGLRDSKEETGLLPPIDSHIKRSNEKN